MRAGLRASIFFAVLVASLLLPPVRATPPSSGAVIDMGDATVGWGRMLIPWAASFAPGMFTEAVVEVELGRSGTGNSRAFTERIDDVTSGDEGTWTVWMLSEGAWVGRAELRALTPDGSQVTESDVVTFEVPSRAGARIPGFAVFGLVAALGITVYMRRRSRSS